MGWGHNRCPLCPPIGGPAPLLQVLFGTADGQVIVMDCHGRMLAHVLLHESDGILSMSWNYPAFLVEDSSESDTDSDDYSPPQGGPAGRAGGEGPLPIGQGSQRNAGQSRPTQSLTWMGLSPTSLPSLFAESVVRWLGPPLVFLDAEQG